MGTPGRRITESTPERTRTLRVCFETREAFRQEYERNIARGGLFIDEVGAEELRELVTVELELAFCEEVVPLPAEIVGIVPPALARTGAQPGVAVQFDLPVADLRERLGRHADGVELPEDRPDTQGRRAAPRYLGRVPARVTYSGGSMAAHTRNLSVSGVLLGAEGEPVPLGERVHVALRHPTTGDDFIVPGNVVRHVESDGRIAAIGVHFQPPDGKGDSVAAFLEDLRVNEHARRLSGIQGSIAELGMPSLLQMFATCSQRGTLVVRRGHEEGAAVFESGVLLHVRLGAVSGSKALVRLLGWKDGQFEFRGDIDPVPGDEPAMPLEGALLDAARQVDEIARLDPDSTPDRAVLCVDPERLAECSEPLDKTEQAAVDLATAGFTVGRVLDVIPVSDLEIYGALRSLLERGLVSFAF